MSDGIFRNREIEKIISDIRQDASTQKECITRYTFHALIFTGAIWSFVFKANSSTKTVEFLLCGIVCGMIVAFMLLMVPRMANHKYHTVNRNLGYELHLYRLKDYYSVDRSGWTKKMQEVGWEEAMCAWRIVQATLFNHLYTDRTITPPNWIRHLIKHLPHRLRHWFNLHWLKPHFLKPVGLRPDHEFKPYRWYATKLLIRKSAHYHPGNYLRNVHWMLHATGWLSIIIMWGYYSYSFVLLITPQTDVPLIQIRLILFFVGLILLFFTLFYYSQVKRQKSRRKILEEEFLSIQSCAVVWRMVVTCHILAAAWALRRNKSYQYYTCYTARLALDINANFYEFHDWLAKWDRLCDSEEIYVELEKLLRGCEPQSDTSQR